MSTVRKYYRFMADANTAILITLDDAHEGGFQNNPNDRANWTGGEVGVGVLVGTNGGITTLDMPGTDIRNITTQQKINYYVANYWKPRYSQINDQSVANKIFDMGVLFGVGTAVKILQRVLAFTPDGIFGMLTLGAVNFDDPKTLLAQFKTGLHAHAQAVADANPLDVPDLPDWNRRIES
jgi:lysozyme family protein